MKDETLTAPARLKKVDKTAFGRMLMDSIIKKFPGSSLAAVGRQVGVSAQRLYAWTSGKALPNADVLPSALEFFGVSFDEYTNLPRA